MRRFSQVALVAASLLSASTAFAWIEIADADLSGRRRAEGSRGDLAREAASRFLAMNGRHQPANQLSAEPIPVALRVPVSSPYSGLRRMPYRVKARGEGGANLYFLVVLIERRAPDDGATVSHVAWDPDQSDRRSPVGDAERNLGLQDDPSPGLVDQIERFANALLSGPPGARAISERTIFELWPDGPVVHARSASFFAGAMDVAVMHGPTPLSARRQAISGLGYLHSGRTFFAFPEQEFSRRLLDIPAAALPAWGLEAPKPSSNPYARALACAGAVTWPTPRP